MSTPILDNAPFSWVSDPPESRVCLCLHGLGGGPYEMRLLAPVLQGRGWAIEAILYPGHGEVARGIGPDWWMPGSTWPEWYRAAEAAYLRLRQEFGQVAIVGFSTGCPLALHLAAAHPEVDRLVLVSPFLGLRRWPGLPEPERALRWLYPTIPFVLRWKLAIRDRRLRQAGEAVSEFRTFNLTAVASALELIDRVKQELPQIDQPTLILQPRGDSVVDPAGAQEIFDRLGSAVAAATGQPTVKQLVWLDHSDHIALLDHDREQVFNLISAFLDQTF